jgi:hypothetical protein
MNNRFAFLPMLVSNDLLGDRDALRRRFADDGYLYFRELLDPERVRDVRRGILGVTQKLGWTEPGYFPMSQRCIVAPLREEDEEFMDGYQEVQRLQTFHELAHDPVLLDTVRQVLGDTAFPHPLKIARLAFPDHFEASTPPHQDFPNNQGTPDLTATWIPVGDMPPELGGLAILRGSHKWGLLPMQGHIGAGNRCAVIPPEMAEECRWVTTEFAMGDVLLFPSLTVHASLHNTSEFFMRLSVDFRYQLEGQALTPGCLEPHFRKLTWEQVYEGWDSTAHQYYWRDLDYRVEPFELIKPIDHTDEFTDQDKRDILTYDQRVRARTLRRMEALGRTLAERDGRVTTFDADRQVGARPGDAPPV